MTSTAEITSLRYETATATLEVTGRQAAVSRWSDRPVVQPHRFRLQLLPSAELVPQGVEIRGDRAQFLALCTALETYIQDHLRDPLRGEESPPVAPGAIRTPSLSPQGLTRHRLHLGSLQTTDGESVLFLSSLQLADLASLSGQLDQQVRLLPVTLTAKARWSRTGLGLAHPWQRWGSLAAGLIAVVGVASLWPSLQQSPNLAPTASQESLSTTVDPVDTLPEVALGTDSEADATGENQGDRVGAAPAAEASPDTARAGAPQSPASGDTTPPRPRSPVPRPAPVAPDASSPVPPPAAESPSASPGDSADSAPEATTFAAPSPSQRIDPGADSSPQALTASPLDTLAQTIASNWSPPTDLKGNLGYRLAIAADGTVAEITPVDDRSADYQDQIPLPEVGTPVLPRGRATTLGVTLYPDGSVTVTPETE
ncbi:DUF4335 domain-containing protein [Leptolyngbya sp. PCC 6406]|uniref:DUF4335 domain-containing protein n=1 Tax=Leptolyngbya sp. PCC 6406 TaxID=1173264 RepID=UPI0002AC9B1F|nr:DUF4335 domain-containing protein [Leptolyngbya sp. PCC 6406]